MLREVKDARFRAPRLGFVVEVTAGREKFDIRRSKHREIQALSDLRPVLVKDLGGKRWWAYRGRLFLEDETLGAGDVQALLFERAQRRERKLKRAHAVMA